MKTLMTLKSLDLGLNPAPNSVREGVEQGIWGHIRERVEFGRNERIP